MKMRLVLLTHPASFGTVSMPRFAGMIQRGMTARGHKVEAWTSPQRMTNLPVKSAGLKKWLGYFDQFVLYPRQLRKQIRQQPADTLFVVTDQALGMWVPVLCDRPHAIHCHDFLALRSALGEFPENPTRWSGKQYQRLILKGFSRGKVFISVSEKTRSDLHRFLDRTPKISAVVHNGLNYPFQPMDLALRKSLLEKTGAEVPTNGFVLHLSGNQWYKNPKGVIEIYRAYAANRPQPAPLWMVGNYPSPEINALAASIPSPGKVQFVSGLNDEQINAAYSHARALLFPSIEEGFGWPIIEAMAAGCPVITTQAAPMTEIGGDAARFIPRMPAKPPEQSAWAIAAAKVVDELVRLDGAAREDLLNRGILNAARFDTEKALAAYENIYSQAMTTE